MGERVTAQRNGDILAIGFATAVAMWTLIYAAAMPPGIIPIQPVAMGLAACLFVAGYLAGRYAGRSWRGGAGLGATITAVNLLILLSLLGGGRDGERLLSAASWIVGFLLAAVVSCALGAALGKRSAAGQVTEISWTALFASVTAGTTLLMIIAGGIVTGLEAGLTVKGWLIAEGHPLVLFPLSLMQRDVGTFVEHAHRLWGLLVGLTTVMLMIHLFRVDRRGWLRWLAVGAVLAVIAQGTLGGTRVTERSIVLGIIHGVFALAVFATLVTIAAATSTTWRSDRSPIGLASVKTDRLLSIALLVAVGVQIILGTLFRHLEPLPGIPRGALAGLLHGHSFVGSVLVVVMVLFCGVRAWGVYREQLIVKRVGMALICTMIVQVLLGFGSFIVVPKGPRDPDNAIPIIEVVLTTAHQATGAILLAGAVALFAWQRRLLRPS